MQNKLLSIPKLLRTTVPVVKVSCTSSCCVLDYCCVLGLTIASLELIQATGGWSTLAPILMTSTLHKQGCPVAQRRRTRIACKYGDLLAAAMQMLWTLTPTVMSSSKRRRPWFRQKFSLAKMSQCWHTIDASGVILSFVSRNSA